MRLTTALVLLFLIVPAARAQQPAATSAVTLRGVVVTDNDAPLPRVRVAVAGSPRSESPLLTDERGQFTVRLRDSDSTRLTFTKARYAAATLDVRRSDVVRNPGGLRVQLSLGGAISGQVRDRSGAPVIEATVTVRRLRPSSTSDPSVLAVTTDDLGEFRFGGLVAGVYAVGARPPAGITTLPAPAEPRDEQTVNVSLGAEVTSIDVTIDAPSELTRGAGVNPRAGDDATASLRGRVVSPRGTPIAGAVVQAYGPDSDVAIEGVETDARGRYVINRLGPGSYRVRAFKRGFIAPSPGQSRSTIEMLLSSRPTEGQVISVRRGQTVDSIELILGRGASITGTIVDEFGEPVQDVAVNVLELRAVAGQTRALRVSAGRGTFGRTDDRGRYRLFNLQPGVYIVQATAGTRLSGTTGYVPMFYPGTPTIDFATPTKVDTDANVGGIDFSLLPQPAHRLRGTVLDPAGNPARSAQLTITRRSAAIQTDPVRANGNADGTFAFDNMAPGDYAVQATTTDRAAPSANVAVARQFAEAVVSVTTDEPPPLQLRLSHGATLMGRVVFEGIASPPPYSSLALTTIPAEFNGDPALGGSSIGFTLLSDHTFEYRGIFGRSLLIAQLKDPAWYVKSITYRGQDLADTPFDFGSTDVFRDIEVVVSANGAVITGRATDDRAALVRDYTVAVIPTDRSKLTMRSRWLKTGRATQDGTFRLTGLVPGDYAVVAVDRLDGSEVAGELQSSEILAALTSRAVRITLGEGQTQDLTLRLIRR